MARLGSKRVAEGFGNDGLADALVYLWNKGWYEPGSPEAEEGFRQRGFEENRAALDRLTQWMQSNGGLQGAWDLKGLRQWVRNQRHSRSKETKGVSSFTCDLTEQARTNLQKLVKRTGNSQRKVVENLLLEGNEKLRREIKLLREEKKGQSKKFQAREERLEKREKALKHREESIARREQELADFRKEAQPLLDLLRDIDEYKGGSHCIHDIKPVLETIREIAKSEGADITVQVTRYGKEDAEFCQLRRALTHKLTILLESLRVREDLPAPSKVKATSGKPALKRSLVQDIGYLPKPPNSDK